MLTSVTSRLNRPLRAATVSDWGLIAGSGPEQTASRRRGAASARPAGREMLARMILGLILLERFQAESQVKTEMQQMQTKNILSSLLSMI